MKLSHIIVATALATGGSHAFAEDKPLEKTDACFDGATNITAAEAKKLPFTEYSTRLTRDQRKCVFDVMDRNTRSLSDDFNGLKRKSEHTGKLLEYTICLAEKHGPISDKVAGLMQNGVEYKEASDQVLKEICGTRP